MKAALVLMIHFASAFITTERDGYKLSISFEFWFLDFVFTPLDWSATCNSQYLDCCNASGREAMSTDNGIRRHGAESNNSQVHDDHALREKIRKKLRGSPYYALRRISCEVSNGVPIL